jgi:hypothetical protein
MAYILIKEDL